MRGSAGLNPFARGAAALLAAWALFAALWLGAQHPVAPVAVLAGAWWVVVYTASRPAGWLFWLPALMPSLNFFPWTGWWLFDESDLFVLAVLAGGYARWACAGRTATLKQPGVPPWWLVWFGVGLALCVAQAFWRGWLDAPALPPHTGWRDALWQGLYADHLSAWNSVRVAKSFVWVLLLAPLAWRAVVEHPRAAGLAFVRGLLAGLALVCAWLLWERESQVGVLDFVSGYRTSAAFWEMHVGGGAIDAYLALTAPLALWAVWMAPTTARWWLAQGLLWLTVYALLTTYSRSVVGAFVVVLLGWALAARVFHLPHDGQGPGRRRVVAAALIVLLVQGSVVIGVGAFLGGRLEQSSQDLLGRWAHWQRALGLLQAPESGRASLVGGLGMGRFTARYHGLDVATDLPGRAQWVRVPPGSGALRLQGPGIRSELAPRFGLTQRVVLRDTGAHTVRLRLAGQPGSTVLVTLCQRHLIHSLACQWANANVPAGDPEGLGWQTIRLRGAEWLPANASHPAALSAVLTLHASAAEQDSRVLVVQLWDAQGRQRLLNTDFAAGLSHWMPAAEAYYQPWHTDNLYLDLLLELGLAGWLLLAALLLATVWRLCQGLQARDALAWAYGAALLGFLAVGLLISATEIPRVLLLAWLTLLMPLILWTKR